MMTFMTFGWQTQRREQEWESAVVMVMSRHSHQQNREMRRFLRRLAEMQRFSQRV